MAAVATAASAGVREVLSALLARLHVHFLDAFVMALAVIAQVRQLGLPPAICGAGRAAPATPVVVLENLSADRASNTDKHLLFPLKYLMLKGLEFYPHSRTLCGPSLLG